MEKHEIKALVENTVRETIKAVARNAGQAVKTFKVRGMTVEIKKIPDSRYPDGNFYIMSVDGRDRDTQKFDGPEGAAQYARTTLRL